MIRIHLEIKFIMCGVPCDTKADVYVVKKTDRLEIWWGCCSRRMMFVVVVISSVSSLTLPSIFKVSTIPSRR